MPLILGFHQGDRVSVGGTPFLFRRIRHARDFTLVNEGTGETHRVRGGGGVEVLPGVRVVPANQQADPDGIRVAFEAPRSVAILREGVLDTSRGWVECPDCEGDGGTCMTCGDTGRVGLDRARELGL